MAIFFDLKQGCSEQWPREVKGRLGECLNLEISGCLWIDTALKVLDLKVNRLGRINHLNRIFLSGLVSL